MQELLIQLIKINCQVDEFFVNRALNGRLVKGRIVNFLQKIVTSALVIVIITGCSFNKKDDEVSGPNPDSGGPNTPKITPVKELKELKELSIQLNEGESKTIIFELLDNDQSILISENPKLGTIEREDCGNNQCLYTPGLYKNGSDQFSYQIVKKAVVLGEGSVKIFVSPVNNPPFDLKDMTHPPIKEDESTTVAFKHSGDPDTEDDKLIISYPALKTKLGTLSNCGEGKCTYTPDPNVFGDESLEWYVTDGHQKSNIAKIEISIEPINDPPTFSEHADLYFSTAAGEKLTFKIKQGVDIEGQKTLAQVINPGLGTLEKIDNNQFSYTPDVDFLGDITLIYKLSDGEALSVESRSITINVTKAKDSDGDLIPDVKERLSGNNPYIADLSDLAFKNSLNSSMSYAQGLGREVKNHLYKFSDLSSDSYWHNYLLKQIYQDLRGTFYQQKWFYDYRVEKMVKVTNPGYKLSLHEKIKKKRLEDEGFSDLAESGYVNYSYFLGVNSSQIKSLKSIDNISIALYGKKNNLIYDVGSSRSIYRTGDDVKINFTDGVPEELEHELEVENRLLPPHIVKNSIINGHDLYTSIKDFSLHFEGQAIEHSNLVQSVKNKTATIIIDNQEDIYKYHFVPHLGVDTMELFLKSMFERVELSESKNHIREINGDLSELFYTIDPDHINFEDLKKKSWFYLSEEKTPLDGKLQTGSTYLLVYDSLENIIKNERLSLSVNKDLLVKSEVTSIAEYDLGTVYFGDILEVSLTEIQKVLDNSADYNKSFSTWNILNNVCTSCQDLCARAATAADNCGYGNCYDWKTTYNSYSRCHSTTEHNPVPGWARGLERGMCRTYCKGRGSYNDTTACEATYKKEVDPLLSKTVDFEDLPFYFTIGGKIVEESSYLSVIPFKDDLDNLEELVVRFSAEDEFFSNKTRAKLKIHLKSDTNAKEVTLGYIRNNCSRTHNNIDDTKSWKTFKGTRYQFKLTTNRSGYIKKED